MTSKRLLEITIEAPTADDAFDILRALPEAQQVSEGARRLVRSASERVDHNELKLPPHVAAQDLLDWVATNLESEEGLLDEDTPQYLSKAVSAAVALLNDPLLPMPCVRSSTTAFIFFDRA